MRRAQRRKYHYIYKTTNILNGKYYIGMHSTDNLEDGYIGSGKRLWHSINKHGKENHVCEILEFLPDRKSLADREAELVNEDALKDTKCMNLKLGGTGSWDFINTNKLSHSKAGKAGAAAFKHKLNSDLEFRSSFVKAFTDRVKVLHSEGKVKYDTFTGKTHSPEARKKIGDANKVSQFGERNSQFGTKWAWVYKDGYESKKILLSTLDSFIADGWARGIKPPKTKVKIEGVKNPQKNFSELVCECCGIKFMASQRDVRRNRKYCGIKCHAKSRNMSS